jgi:hypothetical protein
MLDWFSGAEGVEAWTLVGLKFEKFHHLHYIAGRRHKSQLTGRGREHDAGGGHPEHVDAPIRQAREQVDDVKVLDKVVGDFDERVNDGLISGRLHGASWSPDAPLLPE